MVEEKDLWQQACYSLALKVARQCHLQTLQRLQLSEKSWVKLAEHFAILLSDRDTEQVRKGRVQKAEQMEASLTLKCNKACDMTAWAWSIPQLSKIQEIVNSWKESVAKCMTQLHSMETRLIEEVR